MKQEALIERDVFLAHVEGKPAFFAQVDKITPDVKKGWWQLHFIMLTIPITRYTWILDDHQVRGEEFTMSGIPIRLEKIKSGAGDAEELKVREVNKKGKAKVISLFGTKD